MSNGLCIKDMNISFPSVSKEDTVGVFAPMLLLGAMKDEPEVKEKFKEHGIHEDTVDAMTYAALVKFEEFMEDDCMEIYMYIFYDEHECEHVLMMSINDDFYYTSSKSKSNIESERAVLSSVLKILGFNVCVVENEPEGLPEDYKDVICNLETVFVEEVE